MAITTSLTGVKRKYFMEDGILKAAILRDTNDIASHVRYCRELQDNIIDHAEMMRKQSILLAEVDEADWIMVMEQHGITDLFCEEAMGVAKRVFLQGGDWRYTRIVPDKYISHEALKL